MYRTCILVLLQLNYQIVVFREQDYQSKFSAISRYQKIHRLRQGVLSQSVYRRISQRQQVTYCCTLVHVFICTVYTTSNVLLYTNLVHVFSLQINSAHFSSVSLYIRICVQMHSVHNKYCSSTCVHRCTVFIHTQETYFSVNAEYGLHLYIWYIHVHVYPGVYVYNTNWDVRSSFTILYTLYFS